MKPVISRWTGTFRSMTTGRAAKAGVAATIRATTLPRARKNDRIVRMVKPSFQEREKRWSARDDARPQGARRCQVPAFELSSWVASPDATSIDQKVGSPTLGCTATARVWPSGDHVVDSAARLSDCGPTRRTEPDPSADAIASCRRPDFSTMDTNWLLSGDQ